MKRSQRESSSLGPCWFFTSTLLVTAGLVLPALCADNLRCRFCPPLHKSKSCNNFTIECPPGEICATSRGFYSARHIMSSQGCMGAHLCGSHKVITYRGRPYIFNHTCCCRDKCNISPKSYTVLKMLLGLLKDELYHTNLTDALLEPWNSCTNYTSSRGTTLPVTVP